MLEFSLREEFSSFNNHFSLAGGYDYTSVNEYYPQITRFSDLKEIPLVRDFTEVIYFVSCPIPASAYIKCTILKFFNFKIL